MSLVLLYSRQNKCGVNFRHCRQVTGTLLNMFCIFYF